MKRIELSSKKLSQIAIVIWLCSLALPGIDLYFQLYTERHWLAGYEILIGGWLSPLVGNFAWFANAFFLYGVLQLKSGGTAVKSSIIASILSFDTFRFDQYMMNEGGSITPVYGYGWGAVLWFLSIFLLLAASGKRQIELREGLSQSEDYEWLRPLGFTLIIVTLGTTTFLAVHDRVKANTSEYKRLEYMAFKRGKICSVPDPVATIPIKNFSGLLEIDLDDKSVHASYFPFKELKTLLEWGIPTIRFNGNDYSLVTSAKSPTVYSTPAVGIPAAILWVTEDVPINGDATKSIRATLVETATNRTVFDQTWVEEDVPGPEFFCPDYDSFPNANQQPRRLLMQALNLPGIMAAQTQKTLPTQLTPTIEGIIVEHTEGVEPKKVYQYYDQRPGRRFNLKLSFHDRVNTNCPLDVGWELGDPKTRNEVGYPFMVNGHAYYLGSRQGGNAICGDNIAYLYSGGVRSDGKYYLIIEKRSLNNFQKKWAGIVTFPNGKSSTPDSILIVQSITEANDNLIIKLANEDSGEMLKVQVPLKSFESFQ